MRRLSYLPSASSLQRCPAPFYGISAAAAGSSSRSILHRRLESAGSLGAQFLSQKSPTSVQYSSCAGVALLRSARRGFATSSSSSSSDERAPSTTTAPESSSSAKQGAAAKPTTFGNDETSELLAAAAAADSKVSSPQDQGFVDEDAAVSLDPRTFDFDNDDVEDLWFRVVPEPAFSISDSRSSGFGKARERLARKLPVEHTIEEEEEEDEEDEDEDEDDLPELGSTRRSNVNMDTIQEDDFEGGGETQPLTARELRLQEKEEEKDKKWNQLLSPIKDDVEAQITEGKHFPLWYPHVDEYEGDGYDDYTRTLQDSWDDDTLPFHRDYEYDEKEFRDFYHYSQDGHSHILNVGRHTKTTKAGRVFSFSATVIDGNGDGRAGWGYGKGPTLSDAVIAAQADCEKNSFFIDRYKGNCVTESIRFTYKTCSVELFALPEGRLHPTSSQVMQLVFNAFGLQYIAGKWRGSTNKTKRIKTLFMALRQIEHPDYLSEKLGMKLFKPRKIPRKHGRVWSYD